jgi:hypothetical protein
MNGARESIRWKLPDYLKQRGISVYALQKETAQDVARNTIYRWGREGEVPKYIDLDVLVSVIRGLERLTGQSVSISDLLEVEHDALNAAQELSGEALGRKPSWRDLIGLLGDTGGPTDMSINHDKYIDEALWEEYQESVRGER